MKGNFEYLPDGRKLAGSKKIDQKMGKKKEKSNFTAFLFIKSFSQLKIDLLSFDIILSSLL